MTMRQLVHCMLLAAALTSAAGADAFAEGRLNPIRKVVNLLQAMQKKVAKEGEDEKELYEKFQCHCKHGKGDLSQSIAEAESKAPAVGSRIDESEGKVGQLKAELKKAQEDRETARRTMSEAKSLREKEASSFSVAKSEADTNIAAINKAVAALEKGLAGSFLQTDGAQAIRHILSADDRLDLSDVDRQDLLAFLSQSSGAGYVPQSGEIVGILKQIGETMAKDLAEDTATEEAAVKDFKAMIAAKEREVQALSEAIEAKTGQIGELSVAVVQMKEDLSDTEAALLEDQKFLAELEKGCQNKAKEWEERSKLRAEELVALADTIKVLNDDEALDLFGKTLPSAGKSLMQVSSTSSLDRAKALSLIHDARSKAKGSARTGLDLIALALGGQKTASQGTFDKVLKMCDDMVETLKREQEDDDHKKEYCESQLNVADDSKKALEHRISDIETAMASAKEGMAALVEEIAALEAGIKALDRNVAEATEQRRSENSEYKELMSSNSAAKDLLNFAKNRLNKYYNPKLYKPKAKRELSREDRIYVNHGGEAPAVEAPGGIAGTGITALVQVFRHRSKAERDAPAPPPATWGAYQAKSQESNGVIAMMDLLIQDLTKEMTEAETSEKDSQADYKALMADAADKRAADSKALAGKAAAKAELETELQAHEGSHKAAVEEHMATEKFIASLHSECDWLLRYHDTRKAARSDEIESLQRAKAVLSGADYALLQTRAKGFLGRRQ